MSLFNWNFKIDASLALLLSVFFCVTSCSKMSDAYLPNSNGLPMAILFLEGSVEDEEGNAIEGIEISVHNSRSMEFAIKSDDDGEFDVMREILPTNLLIFIATDVDGAHNGQYAPDTIATRMSYNYDEDYPGYVGVAEEDIHFVLKKIADTFEE